MAAGQAQRRNKRKKRVVAVFGVEGAPRALDLLELLELAGHDCYGEISPSEETVDDMLVLSDGSLGELVRAAQLAVTDWRDLPVLADERRIVP